MKPGIKRLISGALLVTLALLIPCAVVLMLINIASQPKHQFLVPGNERIQASETGRYRLWHHHQTIHHGRVFSNDTTLPDGMRIEITNADGSPLPFHPDSSITSTTGGSASQSVGVVEITRPGPIDVSVTGDFDPLVFSFARSRVASTVTIILAAVGISTLCGLSGLALAIWGLVILSRKPGTATPAATPHPRP